GLWRPHRKRGSRLQRLTPFLPDLLLTGAPLGERFFFAGRSGRRVRFRCGAKSFRLAAAIPFVQKPMLSFLRQSPPPSRTHLEIDGETVAVVVRVSRRARSFRLSLPATGPVLSLPEGARWTEAEAFLFRQRHWLAARLARTTPARRLV